jgi:glycosyltransferase involved in cell wall biosynthesis
MIISIITPTFNAGSTIRETLESVRSQFGEDMEHLVIDACSTDQTLDVAKGFPHVVVRSEPDKGIYDGMNKGAELAQGEWLLFLQGDDWLPEGTIDAYCKAIASNPEAEMICGDCDAVRYSSGIWETVWSVTDPLIKKLTIPDIALGEPMINARLIRRDVFQKLDGFSLKYSLASDRDFLLHAAKRGIQQVEIDIATYRYRWHAGSSTMTEGNSMTGLLSAENQAIAKTHLLQSIGEHRRTLRKWHTRLTVQEAMNLLEKFEWIKLLQVCKEGACENPAWILSFALEILNSLPGFLLRRGKTRTRMLLEGGMA